MRAQSGFNRDSLPNSVVAILSDNGSISGTGFIISKAGLIVTCAHVIIDAGAEPGGKVKVRFKADQSEQLAEVDPTCWSDPDRADLALLKLTEPLPCRATPAPYGPSTETEDHDLHGFGYPTGEDKGDGSLARVLRSNDGPLPFTTLLQLRSDEISPGHSGGPLLDESRGQVVGIVHAIRGVDENGKHASTAYAIPIETLGWVLADARIRKRQDKTLWDLTERVSLSLAPRCGWPRRNSVMDEPGDVSSLEASLKHWMSSDPPQVQALLVRLPQEVVDSALLEMEREAQPTKASWSRALVQASARFANGLALLAAAVVELGPRTSTEAAAFAEAVQKYGAHPFSELELRAVMTEANQRKVVLDSEDLWRLAKEIAPHLDLAEFDQIAPAQRLAWVVRGLADCLPRADGKPALDAFRESLHQPGARVPTARQEGDALLTAEPKAVDGLVTVAVQPMPTGGFRAQIWRRIGPDYDKKLQVDVATEEELREHVSRARASLGTAVASNKQTIEFVLPRSMRSHGFEHWKLTFGRRANPVGSLCRVVIRSWERLFDPDLKSTWGDWLQKWTEYQKCPQLHWFGSPENGPERSTFEWLCQSHVGGIGLNSVPAVANDSADDPISMCDDAGVPVMIWLREKTVEKCRDLLQVHLEPKDYGYLPTWAMKCRLELAGHPVGRCLAVLWDDPNQKPPDFQFAREGVGRKTAT